MRKRRWILYQICGIFLGISCMLSACHEKEETFTSVAAAEADAGDKKNEAESKAAEEKPDKAKADPGGEDKEGSIWVYVCGEVASPGVYELQEGDRRTGLSESGSTSDRWTKDLCAIQRRRTDFERRRFTIGYGRCRDGKRHRNNKPEHRDKG